MQELKEKIPFVLIVKKKKNEEIKMFVEENKIKLIKNIVSKNIYKKSIYEGFKF